MKFASLFLQYLYGGKDLPQPKWLELANQKFQAMNMGYHLGRFVNCLEITMHAYKALLENQGTFFPTVTPLPSLPNFIPGYLQSLYPRFISLDETKRARSFFISEFNYAQLATYLAELEIPAYSHLIIFAKLNKLPGSHALSGLILPDETGNGIRIYLYDAQGFLPDAWLHPEQFDEFYTLEKIFIYDSERTQRAVKTFVKQCQFETANTHEVSSQAPEPCMNSMKTKLMEFLRLEIFRLDAKAIVASQQDTLWQQEKIEAYYTCLNELHDPDKDPYLLTAEQFIQTATIVKKHSYSYNWIDPQSLEHLRTYFNQILLLQPFQAEFALEPIRDYLKRYLICEIGRLSLLNEYSNEHIDKKINLYFEQLELLTATEHDTERLLSRINNIQRIASTTRHWLTFYSQATSASLFDDYLRPVQQLLQDEVKRRSAEEETWDIVYLDTLNRL